MSAGTYICDTCGRRVNTVRRDVVDRDYNALSKAPLWNCEACYQRKRQGRTSTAKVAANCAVADLPATAESS